MKACKTERARFFFGFFVVVSRKNQTHSHRPPPATPARGERELLALPWWHRASWFGSLGGWFWLEKWDFGAWGACRAWLRVLMSHVELCCHCHTAGGDRRARGLLGVGARGASAGSAGIAGMWVQAACSESKAHRDVPEHGDICFAWNCAGGRCPRWASGTGPVSGCPWGRWG